MFTADDLKSISQVRSAEKAILTPNSGVWEDIINLRAVQDRNDLLWKFRDNLSDVKGSPDGTVLSVKAVDYATGSGYAPGMYVQTDTHIYFYHGITQESFTQRVLPFNLDKTVVHDLATVGSFLYVSDGSKVEYCDLSEANPTIRPWYSSAVAALNATAPASKNRSDKIDENLMFDYSPGTPVVVYPQFPTTGSSVPVTSSTERIRIGTGGVTASIIRPMVRLRRGKVYKYKYKNETAETVSRFISPTPDIANNDDSTFTQAGKDVFIKPDRDVDYFVKPYVIGELTAEDNAFNLIGDAVADVELSANFINMLIDGNTSVSVTIRHRSSQENWTFMPVINGVRAKEYVSGDKAGFIEVKIPTEPAVLGDGGLYEFTFYPPSDGVYVIGAQLVASATTDVGDGAIGGAGFDISGPGIAQPQALYVYTADANTLAPGTAVEDFDLLEIYDLDEMGDYGFKPYRSTIAQSANMIVDGDTLVGSLTAYDHKKRSASFLPDGPVKVLPYTDELASLVDGVSSIHLSTDGVQVYSTPTDTEPKIYRAYTFVDVLPDGSVTPPSRPAYLWFDADDLVLDSNLIQEVTLTLAAAAPGAVSRYIYATRWQTSLKDCFTPSSMRYPNGPFFFVTEVTDIKDSYTDKTRDRDLVSPMSSTIPMKSGVMTMLTPVRRDSGLVSPILPSAMSGGTGKLYFADYIIRRPRPFRGTNIYYAGGTAALTCRFIYSDGRRSALLSDVPTGANIQLFGLPAIVASVVFVGGSRLQKKVGPSDPEFHGMPFSISAIDNTAPLWTDPVQLEDVSASSYLALPFPPQNLEIDKQINTAASGVHHIEVSVDADRSTLRDRIFLFGEAQTQVGYVEETPRGPIAKFEVVDTFNMMERYSPVAIYPSGYLFMSKRGLVSLIGGTSSLLVDRNVYPDFFNTAVNGIAVNKEYPEVWLTSIGSDDVLIVSTDPAGNGRISKFNYGSKPGHITSVGGMLIGTAFVGSTTLRIFPGGNLSNTSNPVITGSLTTVAMGGVVERVSVAGAVGFGQDASMIIRSDFGSGRRSVDEEYTTDFNQTFSTESSNLNMKGVYYNVKQSGFLPKFRFEIKTIGASPFLDTIVLRVTKSVRL